MNFKNLRQDFPILNNKIKGKDLIYLDSTASSLKPRQVIEAECDYYENYGVNIFRGVYSLSEKATEKYEQTRKIVADFIGCQDEREIIFTRNATEAINLLADAWGRSKLQKGDNLISTVMEHHANLVPWQVLAREKQAHLRFIDIDNQGSLDLSTLDKIIDKKTKLVALTYVSNVLGTINPIKEIITKIKKFNPQILVLIDAAQAVPHQKVDIKNLAADFLVFSGHKMLSPTGIGVLWGRYDLLNDLPPYQTGGDMIREVYLDHTIYNDVPYRFEAGTPNIAGTIGLGEAIRYLTVLGMDNVRQHEIEITGYALDELKKIEGLTVYGPSPVQERGGVIAFNVKGIHPHDLAQILDSDNICIRSGHHCAMPLHARLNIHSSARASFYIYNSISDV
ncbi:cysteine desulfurase, partial [Candidatus Gottesmanbacteria bacterium RBG_16_37_8]